MDASRKSAVALHSDGSTYHVFIESLCYERLFAGVVEGSIATLYEKAPGFVHRFTRRVKKMWKVKRFKGQMRKMWSGSWTMLRPFTGYTESDITNNTYPDVLICAAVLHSWDVLPNADDDEFYSCANVMWIQKAEEPMLPDYVLERIDWGQIARNAG